MSTIVEVNSERPALSAEQLDAAVKTNISFPTVVKSMVDAPITNQGLSLMSFMFLPEPKKLPNGKTVYGYVKNRGNYAGSIDDTTLAEQKAATIVKEQDSKFKIRIAPTGYWVPITDDDGAAQSALDVRMNEQEIHLRDEAVRAKQASERQAMRELKEREQEVKSKDIYDNPESLEFYTMKRVVDYTLYDHIVAQEEKLREVREKLEMNRNICANLEKTHPEYRSQWIDRYNTERAGVGIPAYVLSEKTADAYNSYVDAKLGVTSPTSTEGDNDDTLPALE